MGINCLQCSCRIEYNRVSKFKLFYFNTLVNLKEEKSNTSVYLPSIYMCVCVYKTYIWVVLSKLRKLLLLQLKWIFQRADSLGRKKDLSIPEFNSVILLTKKE